MFQIRIADLCIEIDNKYPAVARLCREYIVNAEKPDFSVSATDEQIEAEQAQSEHPVSKGYCESICIYREIAQHLPDYRGFVFHAAVIELDGVAYAFAAKSGTGKSTHTSLWQKHFGQKVSFVNGDKPIMRWIDGKLYACGTPWNGKEKYGTNTIRPLQALCFLDRGEKNSIARIDNREVIDRIFKQVLMPTEPQKLLAFLSDIEEMINAVPCYLLKCNISDEAVTVAYNAMRPAQAEGDAT